MFKTLVIYFLLTVSKGGCCQLSVLCLVKITTSLEGIHFCNTYAGSDTESNMPKVTSHPNGDVELQRCRVNGDPCCTGNPRSKSYLVCSHPKDIDGYIYTVHFGRRGIAANEGALPEYNDQAEAYGATGSVLRAASADPSERCVEILIRFWKITSSISEDSTSSAIVAFHVRRRVDWASLYNSTFLLSEIEIEPANSSISSEEVPTSHPTSHPASASGAPNSSDELKNSKSWLVFTTAPLSTFGGIVLLFLIIVAAVLVCRRAWKSYTVKKASCTISYQQGSLKSSGAATTPPKADVSISATQRDVVSERESSVDTKTQPTLKEAPASATHLANT